MGQTPTLSVGLSQVLLAFTIEADNKVEPRLRHTGARPVSLVMWSNVMRYVTDHGITTGELAAASRQHPKPVASLVGGLERWRYLAVDHDPSKGAVGRRAGFGSARGVSLRTVLRPTAAGSVASKQWAHSVDTVEQGWVRRFGAREVDELRGSLVAIHDQTRLAMPRYLPVLSARGLFAAPVVALGEDDGRSERDLPTLLSRVLLALTLDYEDGSSVSLPIAANVLRVLDRKPAPIGSLPLATGVSKEAVSMALTWLAREGYAAVMPNPSGSGKVVVATPSGSAAQTLHARRLAEVEKSWDDRFGADTIATLTSCLAVILDHPALASGLVTPPGGWRAERRYTERTAAFVDHPTIALPHSPIVLHRGGWPDGS